MIHSLKLDEAVKAGTYLSCVKAFISAIKLYDTFAAAKNNKLAQMKSQGLLRHQSHDDKAHGDVVSNLLIQFRKETPKQYITSDLMKEQIQRMRHMANHWRLLMRVPEKDENKEIMFSVLLLLETKFPLRK